MNGIVRLKPTPSSARSWIAQTLGCFSGFFGTMISSASFDVMRSISTGPVAGGAAGFGPLSLSCPVLGGIVMRRP